ncbi:MAG: sulfur carrier protein ThiS [FCB group bacterium]|nr:sulfur carrier protein ThiS [FCB group bacterium]
MIIVNGDRVDWVEGMTVRDVIKAVDYKFPLLITRINGKLIQRDDYDTTVVPDGAILDIIHLMSGG